MKKRQENANNGKRSDICLYVLFDIQVFYLFFIAAPTFPASGPVLPSVATPVKDLLGAVKVSLRSARGTSTVAAVPVDAVDLPETDVDAAVIVLVAGVGVAARLLLDDAITAGLTPARVLGAPCANIDVTSSSASRTSAVGLVEGTEGDGEGEEENKDLFKHF